MLPLLSLSVSKGTLRAAEPGPGLIIVCADGAVLQLGMGSIASGRDCVLHDKHGRALSVAMLSAYNDELAAP